MRTLGLATRRLAGVSALVTLASMLAAPAPANAQGSGRITFVGAIVAPPFGIALGASRSEAFTTGTTQGASHDGSSVTVSFIAPRGCSPAADVALMGAGAAQQGSLHVSARVSGHTGKPLSSDASGHYLLDPQGSVLVVKFGAVPDKTDRNIPLVVMVSYK